MDDPCPHQAQASQTQGTLSIPWRRPVKANRDVCPEICGGTSGNSPLLQFKAKQGVESHSVEEVGISESSELIPEWSAPQLSSCREHSHLSSRPRGSHSRSCAVRWAAFQLFSYSVPCTEWRVRHPGHQLVQLHQPVEQKDLLHHRQTQSQGVSAPSAPRSSGTLASPPAGGMVQDRVTRTQASSCHIPVPPGGRDLMQQSSGRKGGGSEWAGSSPGVCREEASLAGLCSTGPTNRPVKTAQGPFE